jgi:hypothetical protein
MISSAEIILSDMDSTLDQLLHNADAVHRITDRPLFTNEVKAMHKTQESLMARLVHMHELYEKEKKCIGLRAQKMRMKTIEHKLIEFGKLNARLIQQLENGMQIKKKVRVRPSYRKKAIS